MPGGETAPIRVIDDRGASVTLATPARRIVALAPHAAELVYAAGAGDRLVGAVRFSDFPPEVAALPQVGDSARIDLERLTALAPDLIVAWGSGNSRDTLERLAELGYTLFVSEPRRLGAIADAVTAIGRLAGTGAAAEHAAARLRERIAALAPARPDARRLRIFIEIWDAPLMTLNDRHIVAELVARCGGINIFGELPALTPSVSLEAVVAAAPEIVLLPDHGARTRVRSAFWERIGRSWRPRLVTLPADWISRPTPRLLDAGAELCSALDRLRDQRADSNGKSK